MKNVLLIAPSFYGYYEDIKKCLETKGFNVDYFPDQVQYSTMDLVLNKIQKNRKKNKVNDYVYHICKKCNNVNYEYFIMINGKDFSTENINYIKLNISSKKYIYYAWDSVINFPIIERFFKSFDICFSFDDIDCKKYNVHFLPLFYVNFFENYENKDFDYSIIMNFYPNKVKGYEIIKEAIPANLYSNEHLRIKSRIQYLYFKMKYRTFKKYKMNDFRYYNLNRAKVYNIFSRSKIVVDIPLDNQNGLTMRTFEALSCGCKLVTTNKNIKKYDFYDEHIIAVIDEQHGIDSCFFENNVCVNFDVFKKYSLDCFVMQLLSFDNNVKYLKENN